MSSGVAGDTPSDKEALGLLLESLPAEGLKEGGFSFPIQVAHEALSLYARGSATSKEWILALSRLEAALDRQRQVDPHYPSSQPHDAAFFSLMVAQFRQFQPTPEEQAGLSSMLAKLGPLPREAHGEWREVLLRTNEDAWRLFAKEPGAWTWHPGGRGGGVEATNAARTLGEQVLGMLEKALPASTSIRDDLFVFACHPAQQLENICQRLLEEEPSLQATKRVLEQISLRYLDSGLRATNGLLSWMNRHGQRMVEAWGVEGCREVQAILMAEQARLKAAGRPPQEQGRKLMEGLLTAGVAIEAALLEAAIREPQVQAVRSRM